MIPVNEKSALRGTNYDSQLLYFYTNAINIGENGQCLGLFSTAYGSAGGYPIFKGNFREALVLFTARRTISNHWSNNKDEYRQPVEEI